MADARCGGSAESSAFLPKLVSGSAPKSPRHVRSRQGLMAHALKHVPALSDGRVAS